MSKRRREEIKKSSSPGASVGEKRLKGPPRLERVQARTDYKTSLRKQIVASLKVLSASRGGGDVTPGQVEASGKVLLTLEYEFKRDEAERSGVLMILSMGKEDR